MLSAPEIWLAVVGYEGLYEVSDLGRVRRVKAGHHTRPGLVLAARANNTGRLYVNLYGSARRRSHTIHRLVALSFLGPAPPSHEVNHKNGDHTDNRLANLEWMTRPDNGRHAAVADLKASGERHPNAKLRRADVEAIRAARGRRTQQDLAREFGVSQPVISSIQRGQHWKH